MVDNHRYLQQVVLTSIAKGAHSFVEIVSECYGLYPLELQQILDELILSKEVQSCSDGFYIVSKKGVGMAQEIVLPGSKDYGAELPEPHPHDYDWRFDSLTTRKVVDIILQENIWGGSVLLLGTPSIFIELIYSQHSPHTTLIDWSPALIEYLRQYLVPNSFDLVRHNMLCGRLWRSQRQIDVVVMDPPWYAEYYYAFLAQATYVSRIGARIIVSLLPPNTRPEALSERWRIVETAQRLGLHIQSLSSGALRYQTPIFEQKSLQQAHIPLQEDWRRGDMIVFEKIEHPNDETIRNILTVACSHEEVKREWAEVYIGLYKVKLRGPFSDHQEKPELLSIEKDDILPTVSRRYKSRESVDLWLWNNQVFAVRGKAAVLAALYVLSGKPLPQSLRGVSPGHLKLAVALLLYKTELGDSQRNDVWKGSRLDRKYKFVPHRPS